MAGFNERMMKRLTEAITYERAEKLYLGGEVKEFIAESEAGSSLKEIDAVVSNENVSILLNYKRDNIEEFSCSCNEFSSSKKTRACKHIAAAYLRHIKGPVKVAQTSFNLDGVETVPAETSYVAAKSAAPKKMNRIPMVMEPKKEYRKLLNLDFILDFNVEKDVIKASIELLIGENEVYTVSNVRDFLNAVKHRNYSVGCDEGFVFKPKEHYFNKREMEFLNTLYSTPVITRSGDDGQDRKLNLNKETINMIFQLLKDRGFKLSLDGNVYNNVRIKNMDMPLKFQLIKRSSTSWVLKQAGEIPVDLTGSEKYYFYYGTIYVSSVQQARDYSPYYKALRIGGTSSININQSSRTVNNELIPLLQSISEEVELVDISSSVNLDIERELSGLNFTTQIYLDKKYGKMSLNLKFIYGDIELDMFSESKYENASKIKNRQLNKEGIIINEIKSMGFELTRACFVLDDEDKLLDFLSEGINRLQKFGQVTLSDDIKNLRVYNHSDYKIRVGLRENGLLEFSFAIEGISNEEFLKVLQAIRNNDKYYKLLNGGYISLSDKSLRGINNLIEYLDAYGSVENGGTLIASKYNALYVEQFLRENKQLYVEKNNMYRELVNNINEAAKIDFTLPEHLEKTMRPYQKVGFKWLKTLSTYGFGGVLADEMGLGKTLQAIAFIDSETSKIREEKKPVLVVAPTSLVYNWEFEVKKFAPELKTLVVYGNKRERLSLFEEVRDYDIVITSYAVVRNDIYYFDDVEFSYCFIDEAQQIKNSYTSNAKAVKKIKAESYFALTGTPMENSLVELWSVFDFIMPGYLLSKAGFNKKYEDPIILERDKNALEALKMHTRPFMLRRLKEEVMKDLPPKIEQQLVVEMTEEQKVAYMACAYNAKQSGFSQSKLNVLSALTRLRQICCDPAVIMPEYEGESGKMLALEELMNEGLGSGHRMLIFSQFTSVLQRIALMLRRKDIEYYYLDGSTKSYDRLQMSKEFNEGSRDVFLVSLKAGGFGLNLTGADIVVHFDPWWNPAVEEQATDRAHRIGQTKTVEVIKLVAKGTIEEKIFKIQERKREIIESVITKNNAEELIISKLTQEELEDLFNYDINEV